MTSSIHELSDNIESHEKQEQRDLQIKPPIPLGRKFESIATSLVYSEQFPHSMAHGHYPYPDPYYRSIFAPPCDMQAYPPRPYAGVHLQLMGIQQQAVPLPSDAVEEPVFVNAKQYQGILRRRQSRAKLETQNKVVKSRKPYLHESRDAHHPSWQNSKLRIKLAKKDDEHHEDSHEENSNLSSDKSAMAAASSGTS